MKILSFAALLASLQARDFNNTSVGAPADCLTSAAWTLWETPVPLPDAVQAATLPVTGTNLILPSQVGNGSFFRFFDTDPRPLTSSLLYNRLSVRQNDATGIYLNLRASTNPSSVFCLYRPAAPRYTSVVYDNAHTYAVDDLQLFTDGHVYRCVIGATTGTSPLAPLPADYLDSATYSVGNKVVFGWNSYACAVATTPGQSPSTTPASWTLLPWQLQPVALAMSEALKTGARAERRGDLGQFDERDRQYELARTQLDQAKELFLHLFPWCVDP